MCDIMTWVVLVYAEQSLNKKEECMHVTEYSQLTTIIVMDSVAY